MASNWDDTPLFRSMNNLRRHYNECNQCRMADKQYMASEVCRTGQVLILEVMRGFNHVATMKKATTVMGDNMVFPCPDISKHGKAWAFAITPVHVNGDQERLF